MLSLQELITRGIYIFSNSPARREVFNLIDGKKPAAEIATILNRHVNSVNRDIRAIRNADLIEILNTNGEKTKKEKSPIYKKVDLANIVPMSTFEQLAKVPQSPATIIPIREGKTPGPPNKIPIPTEQRILEIARKGEDQLHEFKSQGTHTTKIANEVAAMLNTRNGGLILYGIDDLGNIQGSDLSSQDFDQPLQHSLRTTITPPPSIDLHSVSVMGRDVLAIVVPPWNKKDVYVFNGKILIRKGTNALVVKDDEARKLYEGRYFD